MTTTEIGTATAAAITHGDHDGPQLWTGVPGDLPQELLWSLWGRCEFADLTRLARASKSIEMSISAYVCEGRLGVERQIMLGSGKSVVGFLAWWLRMARVAATGKEDAVLISASTRCITVRSMPGRNALDAPATVRAARCLLPRASTGATVGAVRPCRP